MYPLELGTPQQFKGKWSACLSLLAPPYCWDQRPMPAAHLFTCALEIPALVLMLVWWIRYLLSHSLYLLFLTFALQFASVLLAWLWLTLLSLKFQTSSGCERFNLIFPLKLLNTWLKIPKAKVKKHVAAHIQCYITVVLSLAYTTNLSWVIKTNDTCYIYLYTCFLSSGPIFQLLI